MARPSVITPAVEAAIAAAPPGLSGAGLHRYLAERGHTISRRTLDRVRVRAPIAAATAELESSATVSLEGDDLGTLRETARGVAVAIRQWVPLAGVDARATRALSTLAKLHRDTTAAIVELTPRPPEQRYAPIEAAALGALLARAREAATDDEVTALRERVAAQAGVIDSLLADDDEAPSGPR